MPSISHFYGLVIWLYWDEDKGPHHTPHVHAEYAGMEAVVAIPEGEVLEADDGFPPKKLRMVQTWIDIHAEELMANWNLAVNHNEVFKIPGLDEK